MSNKLLDILALTLTPNGLPQRMLTDEECRWLYNLKREQIRDLPTEDILRSLHYIRDHLSETSMAAPAYLALRDGYRERIAALIP